MNNCEYLSDKTISQISKCFHFRTNGDWCSVVTPFLDRNRDLLKFFLKQTQQGIFITDGGNVLQNFKTRTTIVDAETIYDIISHTDANLAGDELCITTSEEEIFESIIELITACNSLDSYTPQIKPARSSSIDQTFEKILASKNAAFMRDEKLKGNDGFQIEFDFKVQTKSAGAFFLRTTNNPNSTQFIEAFAYAVKNAIPEVPGQFHYAIVSNGSAGKKTQVQLERLSSRIYQPEEFAAEYLNQEPA